MDTGWLQKELEAKKDNPLDLAKAGKGDSDLVIYLLDALSSKKTTVKYKSAKVLRMISEESPEKLYLHFDFFEKLLESENNVLKWTAIDIIANLISMDSSNRFASLFEKFYRLMDEGSLITAGHVIENSAKIIKAKPEYERRITGKLLRLADISLPTEECRSIAAGKVITAFGQYFDESPNKAEMLAFARNNLNSRRPATQKKAQEFLKKFK